MTEPARRTTSRTGNGPTPKRTIRVEPEIWEPAQARADREGTDLSVIVRRALTEYAALSSPAAVDAVAELVEAMSYQTSLATLYDEHARGDERQVWQALVTRAAEHVGQHIWRASRALGGPDGERLSAASRAGSDRARADAPGCQPREAG